jgi:8-oxo-dGTP pyrophosphatase MutT (NUDIX family)
MRWLGRVAYRMLVSNPVIKYHFQRTKRTRIVIINQGQILLVQNWLSRQHWQLPGGGIRSHEDMITAGQRELHEELRISVQPNELSYLGGLMAVPPDIPYQAEILQLNTTDTALQNVETAYRRSELINVSWFSIDDLPDFRSKVVDAGLDAYHKRR